MTAPDAPDEGFRIFLSVDMEGVAGAVTGEQLGPGGFEYARFREFMTDEALAATGSTRAAFIAASRAYKAPPAAATEDAENKALPAPANDTQPPAQQQNTGPRPPSF